MPYGKKDYKINLIYRMKINLERGGETMKSIKKRYTAQARKVRGIDLYRAYVKVNTGSFSYSFMVESDHRETRQDALDDAKRDIHFREQINQI